MSKNMIIGGPMVIERCSVAFGFFCASVSNGGGCRVGVSCSLPSSFKSLALVSYSSSSGLPAV